MFFGCNHDYDDVTDMCHGQNVLQYIGGVRGTTGVCSMSTSSKILFILHIEEKHIYLHFNLYSSLHLFTFLFTCIYIHLLSRMHLNRFPLRHKRTIKAQTSRYNVSGCCSRSLTRRRWAPARWNDKSMKDIYGISLGIEWEILGNSMYIIIYIYILWYYI